MWSVFVVELCATVNSVKVVGVAQKCVYRDFILPARIECG